MEDKLIKLIPAEKKGKLSALFIELLKNEKGRPTQKERVLQMLPIIESLRILRGGIQAVEMITLFESMYPNDPIPNENQIKKLYQENLKEADQNQLIKDTADLIDAMRKTGEGQ